MDPPQKENEAIEDKPQSQHFQGEGAHSCHLVMAPAVEEEARIVALWRGQVSIGLERRWRIECPATNIVDTFTRHIDRKAHRGEPAAARLGRGQIQLSCRQFGLFLGN